MQISSKKARQIFTFVFWACSTLVIAVLLEFLSLDFVTLVILLDGLIFFSVAYWVFSFYPSFENPNGFIGVNVPDTTRAGLFYLFVACTSGLGVELLLLNAQPFYNHLFSIMCSCTVNPLIDRLALAFYCSSFGNLVAGIFIFLSWAIFLLTTPNRQHKS